MLNFTASASVGAQVLRGRLNCSAEARFDHISDGGVAPNPSLNAVGSNVGCGALLRSRRNENQRAEDRCDRETRTALRWVLEGRLAGPLVKKLQEQTAEPKRGCARIVDLSDVISIDPVGKKCCKTFLAKTRSFAVLRFISGI